MKSVTDAAVERGRAVVTHGHDDLAYLDAAEREAWESDLVLRELAKRDPQLAEIVAAADAEYESRTGNKWRNPLLETRP